MGDAEKAKLIDDLVEAVEALREHAQRIADLEKKWGESEWYLGETKARNQRLEDEMRDREHYVRKLEEENAHWRKKYDEAQWCLGELSARCHDLENRLSGMPR